MNAAVNPQESQFERLIRVEKWETTLHMVYDCKEKDLFFTEHATSDWSGTLDVIDSLNSPRMWSGDMDVAVDGFSRVYCKCGDHQDTLTTVAKGNEKYGFQLEIYEDGYVISQGFCNTQFGTTTCHCPKFGDRICDGSVVYSDPWSMKVLLPAQGLTLSGNAKVAHDIEGKPLRDGMTIIVAWDFHPVGQSDTALDPENTDLGILERILISEVLNPFSKNWKGIKENSKDMLAIGALIDNRYKDPRYPKTFFKIITEPNQFAGFSSKDGELNINTSQATVIKNVLGWATQPSAYHDDFVNLVQNAKDIAQKVVDGTVEDPFGEGSTLFMRTKNEGTPWNIKGSQNIPERLGEFENNVFFRDREP